jgi:hypothetical protein
MTAERPQGTDSPSTTSGCVSDESGADATVLPPICTTGVGIHPPAGASPNSGALNVCATSTCAS